MSQESDILWQKCEQVKKEVGEMVGQYRMMREQWEKAKEEMEKVKRAREVVEKGIVVLREMGATARGKLTEILDPLAEQGLREVFGEEASFQTVFKRTPKAGYSARIVTGVGEQRGNPVATDGGSVSEIVSDAILRPLVVCLHRKGVNRIIALDEPFAGVDRKHVVSLLQLLKSMGEKLGVQWLLVSHLDKEILDEVGIDVISLPGISRESAEVS